MSNQPSNLPHYSDTDEQDSEINLSLLDQILDQLDLSPPITSNDSPVSYQVANQVQREQSGKLQDSVAKIMTGTTYSLLQRALIEPIPLCTNCLDTCSHLSQELTDPAHTTPVRYLLSDVQLAQYVQQKSEFYRKSGLAN